MAFRKQYLTGAKLGELINRYNECGKMLSRLQPSLERYRNRGNPAKT